MDVYDDWHFPKCGIDLSLGFGKQPNRALPSSGDYYRTTRFAQNVRTYEAATTRLRGSSRPGMNKLMPVQMAANLYGAGSTWLIQDLGVVSIARELGGNAVSQNSQSGRLVYLYGVSQGDVYSRLPGDTTWTLAPNNTDEQPPLAFGGIMFSAPNGPKVFFADGVNQVYFDAFTGTVERWTPTAGELPVDDDDNCPRLICTWRGRTVQAALFGDPFNWFMSAVSDPFDWNYSPLSPSSTQAVAGNNSPLGFIGDIVTALIPYSDDILIFGGDHTIYAMRGDPAAGGNIDLVTDEIGMAWGMPYCKDPRGVLYFFSNRTGIFRFNPQGQQPERLSGGIEQLLLAIDTGSNIVRMAWDDRVQALHVWVTPLVAPTATTHYIWEERAGAWFTDQYASPLFDPLCVVTYDGNSPNDRVVLLGCWDGYVRKLDPTATTDDGLDITSDVYIGPILTANLDEIRLKDLQAVMGENAGEVTFRVYCGTTAEIALSNQPAFTGTWKSGRNFTQGVKRAGHAIYLRLTSTKPWAMESIRATFRGLGKVRGRGAGSRPR